MKGWWAIFNLDLEAKNLDLGAVIDLFTGPLEGYSVTGTSDVEAAHCRFSGGRHRLSGRIVVRQPGPDPGTGLYTSHPLQKPARQQATCRPAATTRGSATCRCSLTTRDWQGSINWSPSGQPFTATVTLLNSNLDIARIKQWLPDRSDAWEPIRQKLLDQGSVQIDQAELTLMRTQQHRRNGGWTDIKGEMRQISWALGDTPNAEITSLPFALSGKHWQISSGQGQLGSLQTGGSRDGGT